MDNGANMQTSVPEETVASPEKQETPATPKPTKAPMQPRAAAPKRRHKAASLDKRKAQSGWLFVLPFILGLVLIYFPVIFESFRYSISSMTFDKNAGYVFEVMGFDNYQKALFNYSGTGGETFLEVLTSGITRLLIDIPAIVIFSLFIAVILNQKILGRAVFRAIFFIPVICATGIMGSIASTTASLNQSMSETIASGQVESFTISAERIEQMFEGMAIGSDLAEMVIGWVNTISSIIERSGVQMLIFLAALQSISPAIYESCSIDGATTWETFWKITLPMISPMILVNAVYTVIDSFTSSSNTVMKFITAVQNDSNANGGMVVSAAMAWMYFGVIILIVAVVFALLKTFTFYQRRD